MGMTKDTERAMEVITPMARKLGIAVQADEKFLYCNAQAIGIGCNSDWATIMEFIGYVIVKVYAPDKGVKLPAAFAERVKRYWFTKEQIEKFNNNQ